MDINVLWHSTNPRDWQQALSRYWDFVQPRNMELERTLDALTLQRIQEFTPQGWYDFLHDEYFRWKYTARNRYATTTAQLRKYNDSELDELDEIRQQILNIEPTNTLDSLRVAKKIRGLGTAGASGLLSLMFPEHFATVDQFVVKSLRQVHDLPEARILAKMKPLSLSLRDGVLLISILIGKATELNISLGMSEWTPRKIDMVLWTYGR